MKLPPNPLPPGSVICLDCGCLTAIGDMRGFQCINCAAKQFEREQFAGEDPATIPSREQVLQELANNDDDEQVDDDEPGDIDYERKFEAQFPPIKPPEPA